MYMILFRRKLYEAGGAFGKTFVFPILFSGSHNRSWYPAAFLYHCTATMKIDV